MKHFAIALLVSQLSLISAIQYSSYLPPPRSFSSKNHLQPPPPMALGAPVPPTPPQPIDFKPSTYLEFTEIVLDCFNTLKIPLERFPAYLAGVFPEDPETKCFLRCMAIKTGVYCDETGANLERHCLQFGLGECCQSFAARTGMCVEQNRLPCPDRCTEAYKQEVCFQADIEKYLDVNFKALVLGLQEAKFANNLPSPFP